jgi:beta-galactosidase
LYYFGGDYNPEQWPEEVWAEDVALMRQAGVTAVTVGVFSWALLEPAEGRYEFGWLDRVLDLLHSSGIGVVLATPTASPPPWFSLVHPDALPMTAEGVRLTHGSRDTYCASAPAYRAACVRIARELGRRYGRHPALALWHVHNEYGTRCHCDHVADAFRRWLRARYTCLDRLNEAWATAFWSQWYTDWAQVLPPRATQYLANPGQVLDFRRFVSDELLAAYTEQRDVLREFSPGIPVTTNFALGDWVPVDHARWAHEVDLVAIDHYPSAPGPAAAQQSALAADLARSWARAAGVGWLLMEQAAGTVYTAGRIRPKAPGELVRHSLAHVARGSQGAMFFQWRAPRGGAERFHSALVPHAGPGRVFAEACALGSLLAALSTVDGYVLADVAILWDAQAWWAVEGPGMPSADVRYLDAVEAAHRVLYRAGFAVDFAAPEEDLSRYRLVVVPSLYLVSDSAAARIGGYVAAGGHLVVSFFSGIADVDGRVRLGGHPAAFRDILGVRVEEFHPLPPDEPVELSTGDTGRVWSERVHLAGAATVAAYRGGVLDGWPAVTRYEFGGGVAWYLSTRLDDAAYGRILCDAAGAVPAATGVETVRRRGAEAEWVFLLNHSGDPVAVPATGVDLVSGRPVDGTVEVPAGGVAVIRE